MARTFESGPARRERSPVAFGIVGPSGSGKTMSALEMAEGMERVTGGDTWLIDTNNRRCLHHADRYKFHALHMPPPYSPQDCGAACQHAIDGGARRIIFDSISDMHEGEGGTLDMHERFIDERILSSSDPKVRSGIDDSHIRDRFNMTAWKYVKREQLKLKLWLFQQPVDWIFTFRAKEKIRVEGGGKPVDMGWQPLGPEELIYELLFKCLLRPQADGRPVWTSTIIHEQALMKMPHFFRDLFKNNPQMSADIGERIGRWAAGADVVAPVQTTARMEPTSTTATSSPRTSRSGFVERFDACSTVDEFKALAAQMRRQWSDIPKSEREAVTRAEERAIERIKRAVQQSTKPSNEIISADEAREIERNEAERARREAE